MKVLFCGDRNWTDRGVIIQVMGALKMNIGLFTVIEGEARGADRMSREVAEMLGLKVDPYPAQWERYGHAAGPIRNTQMLEEGKPDAVVAFHTNLRESKGTKNMVEQAVKAGLPVWCYENGEEALFTFIDTLRRRPDWVSSTPN